MHHVWYYLLENDLQISRPSERQERSGNMELQTLLSLLFRCRLETLCIRWSVTCLSKHSYLLAVWSVEWCNYRMPFWRYRPCRKPTTTICKKYKPTAGRERICIGSCFRNLFPLRVGVGLTSETSRAVKPGNGQITRRENTRANRGYPA